MGLAKWWDVGAGLVAPITGNILQGAVGGGAALTGGIASVILAGAESASKAEVFGGGEHTETLSDARDVTTGFALGGGLAVGEAFSDLNFTDESSDIRQGIEYSFDAAAGDAAGMEEHRAALADPDNSGSFLWDQLIGSGGTGMALPFKGAVAYYAAQNPDQAADGIFGMSTEEQISFIDEYADEAFLLVFGAGIGKSVLLAGIRSGIISASVATAVALSLRSGEAGIDLIKLLTTLLLGIQSDDDPVKDEELVEDDVEADDPVDEVEETTRDDDTEFDPVEDEEEVIPPHPMHDPEIMDRIPSYKTSELFW